MADTEDMEVAVPAEDVEGAEADDKGPEFEPPQASVAKVIKRAVGESVQVGKEAKATLTRAAGIFILYLTACANDFCREGRRTTITVNDICQALKELDFEDFVEPLKEFLQQYNSAKKSAKESKSSGKAKAGDEGDEGQQPQEDEGGADDDEGGRGKDDGESSKAEQNGDN